MKIKEIEKPNENVIRLILSISDSDEVRDILREFAVEYEVSTYTTGAEHRLSFDLEELLNHLRLYLKFR